MKQSHLYKICQYFKGLPVEYAEQILGIQLSTDQRKILESLVISPYRTLVRSCNNAGKCMGFNMPVMMSDGNIKMIQNVEVGDYVMGADSKPRKVLETHSGRGEMYEIIPNNGKSYTCNGPHILTLKMKGYRKSKELKDYKKGDVINISVEDYLKSSDDFKRMTGGYRVGAKFKSKPVKINPYFLGVWLGDGSSHRSGITTMDEEIKQVVYQEAENRGLKVSINSKANNKASTYNISRPNNLFKNTLLDDLRYYDLLNNKHIPLYYKRNSRKIRLELLAGIIDTDGNKRGNNFEFTNKNKTLTEDVVWLARSLGFASYMREVKKKTQDGIEGTYYRCDISGHCWKIPVKIERKKVTKFKIKRNTLITGIKIKSIGIDNYYGFMIEGDGLYLLDDFTVVHNSFIAAVAALYAYDCYEQSIVIVTAPVFKQIANIVFKEIRTLGRGREGFSPKAPLLYDNPKHQIMGNTASDSTAFQGIHDCNVFVIADELVGIEPTFVEAIEPMLNGIEAWFFLGLYNPTDQASSAFQMELTGKYSIFELNALNHDNIRAEQLGIPAPFPNAVRLSRLREMIEMWCDIVPERSDLTFDFEDNIWLPSPVAEARILGRWPALAANAVWTHHIFNMCCKNEFPIEEGKLQFGVDVAAFGDDNSVIAIRKGRNLIYIESHNGWSALQLAARIKELCNEYHKKYNLKIIEKIPVAIDDGGIGAALRDMGSGYNFIPVNFSSQARRQDLYRIKRDEIHFIIADAAKRNNVSFSRISQWQLNELRTELLAPTYTLDFMGRRVVEKKTKTKELIGRSPDMGDAVMLAFMDIHGDMFEMKPPKMPEYKKKPFSNLLPNNKA